MSRHSPKAVRVVAPPLLLVIAFFALAENSAAQKRSQRIVFPQPPLTYVGDEPLQLSAKATSKLSVSYSSSNPKVAKVRGSGLVVLKAGRVAITATQRGNRRFKAAKPVKRVVTVRKADPVSKLFGSWTGLMAVQGRDSTRFVADFRRFETVGFQYTLTFLGDIQTEVHRFRHDDSGSVVGTAEVNGSTYMTSSGKWFVSGDSVVANYLDALSYTNESRTAFFTADGRNLTVSGSHSSAGSFLGSATKSPPAPATKAARVKEKISPATVILRP